ncbi:MAG: efflux RND transporter periplasmic adaptor subunit [Chthoniobacteraceae bacterium]|jgi:cobalt-zinc-cadmium efflux system membrane fusion protein
MKSSLLLKGRGSIAALAVAVAFLRSSLAQTQAPGGQGATTSGSDEAEASVDLTESQVNAIKIEPIGTYPFPVEKEAVGSVSFDESPSIVQDESTLLGAAATFVLTTKELGRARDLYATSNSVAERELEQAISDQQTVAAALKAARATVSADGKTDAEIDQMIAAGKIDFAEVAGSPTKWVLANIVESDSPLVRAGEPVEVRVEAYPDRVFEGKIARVYATVDPNTHRVAARCEVPDKNDELRSGMLANVTIQVREPAESLAIPMSGVVWNGDGTMAAWVTTDRRHFVQRILKLGLQEDGRYQVLEGLRRGELAVTDGAVFVSNILYAPPSD